MIVVLLQDLIKYIQLHTIVKGGSNDLTWSNKERNSLWTDLDVVTDWLVLKGSKFTDIIVKKRKC